MGQQTQGQRKKRVLEQVEKHRRRQRTITLLVIGVVLVAIIAGGVFVLASQHPPNLPSYLAQCVSGAGQAYHAHAHLSITIDGSPQTIPAFTGIEGGCLRPLHTHATNNVIHIEPDQERTFTLGDFFTVWGKTFNSTSRHFMGVYYAPGQLTMTVTGPNGSPLSNPQFENYVFPRNAQYNSEACSASPCQQTDIVITVTSSQSY